MPRLNGLEVLKALKQTTELPPTIILTTFDDQAVVLEGIRQGARGYQLKDVSLEQLVIAIRTLAAGGTLIQSIITERIVKCCSGSVLFDFLNAGLISVMPWARGTNAGRICTPYQWA